MHLCTVAPSGGGLWRSNLHQALCFAALYLEPSGDSLDWEMRAASHFHNSSDIQLLIIYQYFCFASTDLAPNSELSSVHKYIHTSISHIHLATFLNRHKWEYKEEGGIEILKEMPNKPIIESSCYGKVNIHYFASWNNGLVPCYCSHYSRNILWFTK